MKPTLSIIIVNWNVRDQLEANLARLASLKEEVPFEVLVVDNASQDGSVSMLHAEFPWVQLIANDWNAGFAHACNQALAHAKGDILLLLNPDMLVNPGVLAHTCKALREDSSIGVLGVRLEQGETGVVRSVRRDPGVLDQLAILLKLPHFLKPLRVVDRYFATDMDYKKTQRVEQIRGSYFAFRRDVLDSVGPLDERFYIWFEEVDYCKRVRAAGYSVVYDATVSCRDLVGRSFMQVPLARKQRLFSRSMAQYIQKYHGFLWALPFWILRPAVIVLAWIQDVFKSEKV